MRQKRGIARMTDFESDLGRFQIALKFNRFEWNLNTALTTWGTTCTSWKKVIFSILDPSMDNGLPHEAHQIEKNLFNFTYYICFMSSFSSPTDMNWFHECPSWLGHPKGLREQHPGGLQQESTFSLTHTY